MDEKYVILFTRHQLTDAQISEIETITKVKSSEFINFAELATRTITPENVSEIFSKLSEFIESVSAGSTVYIFGVVPAPLKNKLLYRLFGPDIHIYESWNLNRAPEGQKPEFEHYKWLLTGKY